MTATYPVRLDVESPAHFQRVQLLLRLVLSIVLGFLGLTGGWLAGLLFLGLPVTAAIGVSTMGAVRYRIELVPRGWKAIAWLLEVWAYMAVLIDRFPATSAHLVHTAVRPTGTPTIGSALTRIVLSIPSALVLGLLWCASSVVTLVIALFVLFGAAAPASLLGFQRGVLRWNARLVAYHASIVEEYPPFSLDTEDSAHDGTDRWYGEPAVVGELRT